MGNAIAPAIGGPAAPGSNAKPLSGSAAPASNGNVAGSSSTPSAEAALVEAKRQAEHWRHKYERDMTPALERLAKLEGLAEGSGVGQAPANKQAARTIADLDDAGLDEIFKKGVAEGNHGFVSEVTREISRRAAEKVRDEVLKQSRAEHEQFTERQRTNARITSEFGAEVVLDESSPLRQRADQLISAVLRRDKDAISKNPEIAYTCFAAAARELEASDRSDLERLRKEAADRAAREEQIKQNQTFFAQRKSEVSDLLARGDKASKREALKKMLPFLNE